MSYRPASPDLLAECEKLWRALDDRLCQLETGSIYHGDQYKALQVIRAARIELEQETDEVEAQAARDRRYDERVFGVRAAE